MEHYKATADYLVRYITALRGNRYDGIVHVTKLLIRRDFRAETTPNDIKEWAMNLEETEFTPHKGPYQRPADQVYRILQTELNEIYRDAEKLIQNPTDPELLSEMSTESYLNYLCHIVELKRAVVLYDMSPKLDVDIRYSFADKERKSYRKGCWWITTDEFISGVHAIEPGSQWPTIDDRLVHLNKILKNEKLDLLLKTVYIDKE